VAFLRKRTCNWASGKQRVFSPGAAACHRGRTRAPGASELSFSIFSSTSDVSGVRSQIGRRHQTSNCRSDVCFQRLVEAASCVDVRSEIGRLPKWDVRFEIGNWMEVNWIEVQSQNEETSDLPKSGENKGIKGLAKIRRACGPTPVARGWLQG